MGKELAAAQLSQQLSASLDHVGSAPSVGLTAAHKRHRQAAMVDIFTSDALNLHVVQEGGLQCASWERGQDLFKHPWSLPARAAAGFFQHLMSRKPLLRQPSDELC